MVFSFIIFLDVVFDGNHMLISKYIKYMSVILPQCPTAEELGEKGF